MSFTSEHRVSAEGLPAGGTSSARGVSVEWQNGQLSIQDDAQNPNGAFVEDVIQIAHDRIEFYQTVSEGRFSCRENETALLYLRAALRELGMRSGARESAGVLGTHAADQ